MNKGTRIDIRVPQVLLKEIEFHKDEEKFSTRTGALLDLVRLGLKTKQKEAKE